MTMPANIILRKLLALTCLVFLCNPIHSLAQAGPLTTSAEPFKLGTFGIDGIPTLASYCATNSSSKSKQRIRHWK
jgi:hypothetical protein